jgi:hypothetical protein
MEKTLIIPKPKKAFSLVKAGNVSILHINEESSVCPFRAQAPAQDGLGKIQFLSQPCDSRCPHFRKIEYEADEVDPAQTWVELSCGNGYTRIYIAP